MEKLMGCNKNRSQEIDLYDKPYSEKIERVRTMYKQATSAFDDWSETDIEILDDDEEDKKENDGESKSADQKKADLL